MNNVTARLVATANKIYANMAAFWVSAQSIVSRKGKSMENDHHPQQEADNANHGTLLNDAATDPAAQSTKDKFKQWLHEQVWKPIDWSHILQTVGLLVGLGVAYIYWNQLTQMSNQTRLLGEQADRAVIEDAGNAALTNRQLTALGQQISALQKANEIAVTRDRPWIGQVTGPISDVAFQRTANQAGEPQMEAMYKWRLKNGGVRPARILKIETTHTWFKNCVLHPSYEETTTENLVFGKGGETTKPLVMPNDPFTSTFQEPIPWPIWQAVLGGHLRYCVYISIEYIDLTQPEIIHHTRDCAGS